MQTPVFAPQQVAANKLITPAHLRCTAPFPAQRRVETPPQAPCIVRTQLVRQTVRASAATTPAAHGSGASGAETACKPPLNIVFVSAEVAPWSKTGGLGDVVGGLPIALANRGHRVITIAPRYDQYKDAWDTSVDVQADGDTFGYFHTVDSGVDRVWVDHPLFLAKVLGKTGSKLYGVKSGADYSDNLKRFKLFNHAALEALRSLPFGPGEDCVIVCNDWHTALLPVLLKEVYQPKGEFLNTKVALTIHNIAFQGRFWAKEWKNLGLPESALAKFAFSDGYPRVYDETEDSDAVVVAEPGAKFDKLNWLQAGILSADKLLTVSPNYASEVAEDASKGVELDGVIRQAGGIEGIVNGMDTAVWCPTLDEYLDVKYDEETVAEGKAFAKETLQAELGLPVDATTPLFGFIGRLEEQKGVDVLLEALPQIAKSGAQVVILGTGKKALEAAVEKLSGSFPSQVAGVVEFNSALAHLITAGADYMLVPSRFEPCGLIQMHAMQYGTVPVVASTGGLIDTVKEGVTGFHMGRLDPDRLEQADVDALAAAVARAGQAYGTPEYEQMRDKCIQQDLSWDIPAAKWESVLQDLKAGVNTQVPASNPTPVKNIDVPADPKKSDIMAGRAPPKGTPAASQPRSIGQAVQQATGVSKPAAAGAAQPVQSAAAKAPSTAASAAQAKPPSAAAAKAAAPVSAAKPSGAASAANPAKAANPAASAAKQPAAHKPASAAAASNGAKPAVASNGAAQPAAAVSNGAKPAAAASKGTKPAAAASKGSAKPSAAQKKGAQ